ncbi:hypothetical protein Tco_0581802 [Tanacetum coccineum]
MMKGIASDVVLYEPKGKSTGSSEGAGITPEVPDEPKGKPAAHDDDWGSDEEEVIISSNDKRTESENEKEDEVMTDAEKVDAEKSEEEKVVNEQARDDQADKDDHSKVDISENNKAKSLISVTQNEKPELPPSTSSLSLSSDYDIPVQQKTPSVKHAPLLNVLVSMIPSMATPTPSTTSPTTEIQATTIIATGPSPIVLLRLSELEKKVEALSKVNHSEIIYTEVQNQLPKAVSDFVESRMESTVHDVLQQDPIILKQKDVSEIHKIKLEHASKEQVPKYSATSFNQTAMDEYHQKDILSVAEPPTHKRRCHDDEGQDPPPNSEKEQNKQRRKDTEPPNKSSTSKESSKVKTPPKTSKTSKSVTIEESVEEHVHEVAMDVEEPILDDVVNDVAQPLDDSDPRKYNSTWFKQPPRPKTLDLEWNQDKNVDDGPEQTWFNDLVNAEKDSLTFDELMATPIDFTKFAMNRLKLDKITKADLVGPVYKLLKGTKQKHIELESNMINAIECF